MHPEAVLLDLDGVLYVEDKPVAGAVEAVERLREAGFALRLVTNTTSRSRAATLENLRALGFRVTPEELVTPAALAVRHCVEHDLGRIAAHERRGQGGLRAARRGRRAPERGDRGRHG